MCKYSDNLFAKLQITKPLSPVSRAKQTQQSLLCRELPSINLFANDKKASQKEGEEGVGCLQNGVTVHPPSGDSVYVQGLLAGLLFPSTV